MALVHLGISSCALGKNDDALVNLRQRRSSYNHNRRRAQQQQQQLVLAAFPTVHHHIVELAQEVAAGAAAAAADGPIELPSEPETTPVQIGASVVLLGTIAVLLFRSIRRRFKQAKEQKVRSSGIQPVKEQAKKSILEKLARETVETPPPNAQQTVYGALLAGAIAFVMYQLTLAVENNFASRPITTTDYSIRNISVTVRTIISGMCYLATFVFAADALGLMLYGLQLALNPPADEQQEQVQPQDQQKAVDEQATSSSSSTTVDE